MIESERSNLNRPPLMEINASSQNSQSKPLPLEVMDKPHPAVIDLSLDAEVDTSSIVDNVIPVPLEKPKAKKAAVSKPRAPAASKTSLASTAKIPAAKKVKKTKIELEFDKLSPKEMLSFLSARMQLIGELELQIEQQIDGSTASGDGNVALPESLPNSGKTTEESQLCSLRLELGSVLSQEAELRGRERRLRLSIKRLQRKITLAQSPIVCKAREAQPMQHVADKLFISAESSSTGTASSVPPKESRNVTTLWSLAQQNKEFEEIAAPRLLDIARDATLIDTAVVCDTLMTTATIAFLGIQEDSAGEESAEPETAGQAPARVSNVAVSANPSPPESVQITIVDNAPILEAGRQAPQVAEAGTEAGTALVAESPLPLPGLVAEDTATITDIYDVIDDAISSGGSAQPKEEEEAAVTIPADVTKVSEEREASIFEAPVAAVSTADLAMHRSGLVQREEAVPSSAEPDKLKQLFRQFEYRNDSDIASSHTAKRAKLNLTEEPTARAEPASAAAPTTASSASHTSAVPAPAVAPPPPLTAPSAPAEVLCIDLTSPDAVAPSSGTAGVITTQQISIDLVSLSGSSASQLQSQSQPQSQSQSQQAVDAGAIPLRSGATLPPTAVRSANSFQNESQSARQSKAHAASQPAGDSNNSDSAPDCLGCVIHYVPAGQSLQSQSQSQVSQASGTFDDGPSSQQDPSAAPRCTSTVLATMGGNDSQHSGSDRSITSEEIRNTLDSTEMPEFASMPVQKLRDIVLFYGLRVDSKSRMVSLLTAMWQRLHSSSGSEASAPATVAAAAAAKSTSSSASAAPRAAAAKAAQKLPKRTIADMLTDKPAPPQGSNPPAPATAPSKDQSTRVEAPPPKKARTAKTTSSQLSQLSQAAQLAKPAQEVGTGNGATTKATSTKREYTAAELSAFIKSRPEWYEQVLCYAPLDLDKLLAAIQSSSAGGGASSGASGEVNNGAAGNAAVAVGTGSGADGAAAKVSKARLLELLDEMAVFVSVSTNSGKHRADRRSNKAKAAAARSQSVS